METTTKKQKVRNHMRQVRLNSPKVNEIKRSELKKELIQVWFCKNCDSMNAEVQLPDSKKEVFCTSCGDVFTIVD